MLFGNLLYPDISSWSMYLREKYDKEVHIYIMGLFLFSVSKPSEQFCHIRNSPSVTSYRKHLRLTFVASSISILPSTLDERPRSSLKYPFENYFCSTKK